ncbi:efflux RND transporter periplasmic adaptor subunit [Candidatus Parcubacteria bacterium]|nr:efflux RND transporter periplasmic adaptor subunit [Candidatus Parcubacteria bacterium]
MKNLIINKTTKMIVIGIILMIGLIISGYVLLANKNESAINSEVADENIITVQTYRVAPKTISSDISLSGATLPLDEVMVSPKMSGKVVGIYAQEGSVVQAGQTLIQLEQDQTLLVAYNNAQAGLTNTIAATNQDISMAELAVLTVETNLGNTKINTKENIRNAELAVAAAKVAVESAEKSLGNTKSTSEQTIQNAYNNIKTTMQSNLLTINTALTAVGDILGESPGNANANDDYEDVLGVKDSQSLRNTKKLFLQAKNSYNTAKSKYDDLTADSSFNDIDNAVNFINDSLDLIKQTLNQTMILLDNTITMSGFTATNLSTLKTSVDTNLTSVNTAISTLQTKEQTIINAKLADTASGDTAQAAYDTAKSSLEITGQTLVLAKSQAKAQIDAGQKQLESAQAGLESAKKRADQQITAAQGQLDSVQAQLGNTTISAPISGTVNQIFIDIGEMAMAGGPVVSIVNTSGIRIELSLTEFDINQVSIGQDVKIALAACPNDEFIGQIYYVSSVADAISKKFPIKIQLNNQNRKIKAGMVADVKIIVAQQENVLVIPQSAIFIEHGIEKVYAVKNSIIEIKNIKTENVDDDEVKIVEGLIESEEIVINGSYELKEGDEVNVKI